MSLRRDHRLTGCELGLVWLVFLVALQLLRPEAPFAELSTDEGLNLSKAYLLKKGFVLYSQIWSDQPPLFTIFLRFWLDSFGWSVDVARRLVGVFAALLLTSVYGLVRLREPVWASLLSCGLLMVTAHFFKASGAALIGLPALSLAFASLFLLNRQRNSRKCVALSGLTFGCALATKLFVGIYLPVFLALLARTRKVKIFGLWVLSLLLAIGLVAILQPAFLPQLWEQMVSPHIRMRDVSDYPSGLNHLRFDMSIVLTGLLLASIYIRRLALPFALFSLGLAVLAFHGPSWWHHYLLASIPLCWMIGEGAAWLARDLHSGLREHKLCLKTPVMGMVALLFCYILLTLPVRLEKLRWANGHFAFEIPPETLEVMKEVQTETSWIATDRPILAFALDRPVPPELAVVSFKRFQTEAISYKDFFAIAKQYQAEQVVLSRFQGLKEIAASELDSSYELVLKHNAILVYHRKGLHR